MITHSDEASVKALFEISFGKRQAEELYDMKSDPDQIVNLAAEPKWQTAKTALSAKVDAWMRETHDPRVDPATNVWDTFPYFGTMAKELRQPKQ